MPSVVANMNCSIPLTTLTSSPFNLVLGQIIYVKIIAYNAYGYSTESTIGGGAVIVHVPDAPINLINVVSVTTANQIGISWSNGVSNGGSVIIDYEVYYD